MRTSRVGAVNAPKMRPQRNATQQRVLEYASRPDTVRRDHSDYVTHACDIKHMTVLSLFNNVLVSLKTKSRQL